MEWISKDPKPYILLSSNPELYSYLCYEIGYGIMFIHFKLSILFPSLPARIGNPVFHTIASLGFLKSVKRSLSNHSSKKV